LKEDSPGGKAARLNFKNIWEMQSKEKKITEFLGSDFCALVTDALELIRMSEGLPGGQPSEGALASNTGRGRGRGKRGGRAAGGPAARQRCSA
jgi:hypothetical protein